MRDKLRFPVRPALPVLVGAACVLTSTLPALAQTVPDCSTLSHPVYVAGSTAVKPFLLAIATKLAAATPPITIVYQGQGSCVGVNYMTTSPAGTISGTGTYWDTAGTSDLSCNLTAITGDTVDIGVSDVFASSCGYTAASGVHDFYGPVQSMTFAVPQTSTQTSISAEAAYMVFGFGADSAAHTIAPWTDPTALEVRSASSGTQQMISAALAQVNSSFTAAKVKGVSNSGSGAVLTGLTALAASANQEKAIGFLATDVVDSNRASVKALAYQAPGQSCGYTPDLTAATFDKQNVRDGHYQIWGPLHMLAVSADAKKADKAEANTVISYLTGTADPGFDLISVEAKKGVVPDCAMRVMRTTEVGPLASYMPLKSCECKFIAATGTTLPSYCTTCDSAKPCTDPSRPACNSGYCEVR